MQHCKRHLNNDTVEEEDALKGQHSVQAVTMHIQNDGEDEDIIKVEACTASTNTYDDYAHRGSKL